MTFVVVRFTDGDAMPWGEPVADVMKHLPDAYKYDFEEFSREDGNADV